MNTRVVVLFVLVAVLLFGGIGITGAAAQSALPGDALYPVKTTIEQTRLSMAQDAGDRAQMKMVFAEQRLGEISGLIQEGRYHEINEAVLAFEGNINAAIIELETVTETDPARAARIAQDITSALTRYAQTLSVLAASAPDSVKPEVERALDTTQVTSGLSQPNSNDNSNANDNDNSNANENTNGDDSSNANDNGDDNGNANLNDNSNANDNTNGDDSSNANDNGDDDSNTNGNDDNSNDNGDDDSNTNGDDDSSNANDNGDDNSNTNGDDDSNDNSNTSGDDSGNDNGDDNSNTSGDDSSNDNSNDDHGGDDNSGSGR